MAPREVQNVRREHGPRSGRQLAWQRSRLFGRKNCLKNSRLEANARNLEIRTVPIFSSFGK
jgi:hypothetical protein